jgi:hypothetical protein
MKPSQHAKVVFGSIFDRQWISYIYFIITLIICGQASFKDSFTVGAAALLASALCYFATAGFAGSYRARHDKNYNLRDLGGIAAIAAVLAAGGVALMAWSGFRLGLFGVAIDGPVWAFIGIIVAAVTTKREHAL